MTQFLPTDRVIAHGKQRGVIRRIGATGKYHVALDEGTTIVCSRYEIEHDDDPQPIEAYRLNADQQIEVDAMGEDLRDAYDRLRCDDENYDMTHDEAMAECVRIAHARQNR